METLFAVIREDKNGDYVLHGREFFSTLDEARYVADNLLDDTVKIFVLVD